MRTTLTLEPSAADFVIHYAQARAMRLGEAVSALILRAKKIEQEEQFAPIKRDGLWVFDQTPNAHNAPKLKASEIKAFLEDGV